MMQMIEAPSPNFNDRRLPISLVVVHYTGMKTGAEALARLRDPAAQVSAHYMIEEDGRLFRLVPEDKRAWHAGVSHWAGVDDVNSASIGIELVNPGHEWGYRPFPDAQINTLSQLLQEIFARHELGPEALVGHDEVAPGRKQDPGELFPWPHLAQQGLAVWPRDELRRRQQKAISS